VRASEGERLEVPDTSVRRPRMEEDDRYTFPVGIVVDLHPSIVRVWHVAPFLRGSPCNPLRPARRSALRTCSANEPSPLRRDLLYNGTLTRMFIPTHPPTARAVICPSAVRTCVTLPTASTALPWAIVAPSSRACRWGRRQQTSAPAPY